MKTQDDFNRQIVAYLGALIRIVIEKDIANPKEIERYYVQILHDVDEHMTQQRDEVILEWAQNNPGDELLKKVRDAIENHNRGGDAGSGPTAGC